MRFAACWQHVADGRARAEGRSGLLSVIEQLQGLEVAAGEWERSVFPARVSGYDPRWLDELCLAGEVAWGRLTPRPGDTAPDTGTEAGTEAGTEPGDGRRTGARSGGHRGSATPSSATPLAIVTRPDLTWMLAAGSAPIAVVEPAAGVSADVLAVLRSQGARFRSELASGSGRLDAEIDEGLWDLVARGIVTADAFSAVLCSLKPKCTTAIVRKVTRDVDEDVRDQVRALADTEAFQQSRRERKKIEMRFAHMKRILRLDRLRLRGLSGARDEVLLTATAQNLRRLAKLLCHPPPLAAACPA